MTPSSVYRLVGMDIPTIYSDLFTTMFHLAEFSDHSSDHANSSSGLEKVGTLVGAEARVDVGVWGQNL